MPKWLNFLLDKLEDFLITPWFLGRIPCKLANRNWILIKGDQDINPSFPHLHDKEDKRYKMDIYTGVIYKNKIGFGQLNDKDFQTLWSDTKFLNDVIEIRKTYIYGEKNLPSIPKFK